MQVRPERGHLLEDHLHVFKLRVATGFNQAGLCQSRAIATIARFGIAEVDRVVGGESRVQRHIEQAALSARMHLRQARHRIGDLAIGRHDAQVAGSFRDEIAAIGHELEGPRHVQPPGNHLDIQIQFARDAGCTGLVREGRFVVARISRACLQRLSCLCCIGWSCCLTASGQHADRERGHPAASRLSFLLHCQFSSCVGYRSPPFGTAMDPCPSR